MKEIEFEIEQIETKEDSAAKLNAVAGLPTKNVLFAKEFNAVVKAVKNAKIIKPGELSIYKVLPNQDNSILQEGDYVEGFVEGQFIRADYLGGDPQLLESYGLEKAPTEESDGGDEEPGDEVPGDGGKDI